MEPWWQKTSAGLEDDPTKWIPVVLAKTGVDLSSYSTVDEFTAACAGIGGVYTAADKIGTTMQSMNSGYAAEVTAEVTAAVTAAVTSSGTAGVGYATGAGGAVTQATSRTTGVTLDKTTGAITLFSAAGTTSATTFTVTNSTVAATDVIILNQKSGTDLYDLMVTAVAAGSFNITFRTTGGTTTEQPVFNFAVIKGVAA